MPKTLSINNRFSQMESQMNLESSSHMPPANSTSECDDQATSLQNSVKSFIWSTSTCGEICNLGVHRISSKCQILLVRSVWIEIAFICKAQAPVNIGTR